jgi:hypothetical protein
MAKQSLEHSLLPLNPPFLDNYDLVIEKISKAHALASVALSEHFFQCDHSIMHEYLSLLEDLIDETKKLLLQV